MLISCVRPGVLLTRASCFCPHSAFIALDLPALERPAKVISGRPSAGSCVIFANDIRNSAPTNGFGMPRSPCAEWLLLLVGRLDVHGWRMARAYSAWSTPIALGRASWGERGCADV